MSRRISRRRLEEKAKRMAERIRVVDIVQENGFKAIRYQVD